MSHKTALITGASNGIGLELAKIHAEKGGDLILIARSGDKLNSLKQELEAKFKIKAIVIEIDLTKPDAVQNVYDKVKKENITVDYLINNAGLGDFGFFYETEWEKEADMIQLNITTLTHLTKLFLQDMVKRKSGKIMNLASVAAFPPGPLMAVYYATKHYVLAFSEGIANEVKDKGITVTALCPGATDTGFKDAADAENSKLFQGDLPTAKEVAKFGYEKMMKGEVVAIHGLKNKILANSIRFTPRKIVTSIVRKMTEK